VPDKRRKKLVLPPGEPEPFQCQECHWRGKSSELIRVPNDDGSLELQCPQCKQAHFISRPSCPCDIPERWRTPVVNREAASVVLSGVA